MRTNPPATIVAVTSRSDRHRHVVDRAAAVASQTGATVILYAFDAAPSPLESPLPTGWSSDGTEEQFGDRLDPGDLDAAGQAAVADQVRAVRAAGVKAFGWLPPKAGAESLADYAARQRADLVLVSTEDADLVEALRSSVAAVPAGVAGGQGDRREPRNAADAGIRLEAVPPG